MPSDPVDDLAHDHADINRRVLALGALIRAASSGLAAPLAELRELLFLHFAREEEGLFPYVSEHVPALAGAVHDMASAHDAICGALARMSYLAAAGDALPTIATVYTRFATAYAEHSARETALLADLATRLQPAERAALLALLASL